jgi:hypothetical protein
LLSSFTSRGGHNTDDLCAVGIVDLRKVDICRGTCQYVEFDSVLCKQFHLFISAVTHFVRMRYEFIGVGLTRAGWLHICVSGCISYPGPGLTVALPYLDTKVFCMDSRTLFDLREEANNFQFASLS